MAINQVKKVSYFHRSADRLLILFFGIISILYFYWRFTYSLIEVNPFTSLLLLAVEIYTLLSASGYLFILWNLDHNPKSSNDSIFTATVDVFIPTYNEPFEVIAPAIAAAKNIRNARQVIVLDDGAREWVSDLSAKLQVGYHARAERLHAKAGNLNEALARNDAQFILVLDCDHIAKPEIIEKLLPYFRDEKVALVQSPQNFYNFKSFQHYYQSRQVIMEEDLFYLGLLAGRDPINATFWCGTGALIRTAALRDIGGVPTTSITEDILATLKMHKRGWKTKHHREILARGLAAQNIEQYQGQRYRWGVGAMQVLRNESIIRDSNLTWKQKVSYIATLLGWFDSWKTLIALALPGIVFATGWEPITDGGLGAIAIILGYFLAGQFVVHYISHGLSSFKSTMIFEITRLPATLAATMTIFSNKQRGFKVTQKISHSEESTTFRSHALIDTLLGLLLFSIAIGFFRTFILDQSYFSSDNAAIIMFLWVLVNLYLLVVVKLRIQSKRFGTTRRLAGRMSSNDAKVFQNFLKGVEDLSVSGARLKISNVKSLGEFPRDIHLKVDEVEFKLLAHLKAHDSNAQLIGVEWDEKDKIEGAKLFAKIVVLGMGN